MLLAAPEPISIQLKWQHSFQFAGYYAAIEKGFYRDAGLDVTLKEIDLSKDFVEQVVSGESEYGVSDSTLLIYHLQDKPVVLLNQFFQHSPLVFLSRRDSGIVSPYEMEGKTLAFNVTNKGDASLNALLLNTLGDLAKVRQVPFNASYFQQFIDGKIDVVSAYSMSQPYLLKELGVDVNIINPQSYGIDYYGDNLFTSQQELDAHPERVEKVIQATVKGWQYALDHPDEIIRLIAKQYAPAFSKRYLQYQARAIRQMIIPELIELGSIDPRRYQRAAEDYQRLGFTESSRIKKHFFYKVLDQDKAQISINLTAQEKAWIKAHPQVLVGGDPDWTPFNFANENGQYRGIANDYLNLLAKKTGLKFKISIDQWSHNLAKIRDNQIDLLGTVYYTEARSQYLSYSKPYFEMLNYFFIRDDLDVKTFEDLNGKRVAIPKDYVHEELIKKHFPKINIVSVNTFGEAIDAVLENRADILYDTYGALTYTIEKEGINTIIPFKSTRKLGKKNIHIATRKNAPELASIIQKGLDAISVQEKQAINNKWLGNQQQAKKQTLKLTVEQQQWLNSHPNIRLAVDSNWPPYEFVDQSGKLQGISVDVLSLVEQRLGIQFEVVSKYSWAEMLEKAKNHDIDILSSITQTPNRELYLDFTQPFFTPLTAIYTRKDNADISSLADLKNKTVVIENQYFLHERLAKEYPEIKLLPVETTLEALKTLSYGKVEAYVGNQGAANWIAEQNAINNLKLRPETELGKSPLRLAVRNDWPIFKSILNKALTDISSLELSAIRRKWMGNKSDSKQFTLNAAEQKWLKNHPEIRIGNESNWPPYEFIDPSGQMQGLSVDVIRLVEQRLGIKFKIISQYPWAETLEKVKNHDIDMISSIAKMPEREQFLSFSKVYVGAPSVIYTRKDSVAIFSLDDLKQKTVAVENQYYIHKQLIAEYPEIKLLPVNTTADALKALSHGKADAYVGNQGVANWVIEKNVLTNLQVANDAGLGTADLRLAVRKDWPIFQQILDKVMASISETELSAIRRKWLGIDAYTMKLSLSATEQQWLNQHKTIRFTGDPNWLPYEAFDQKGNYIGIVAEHLKLIEKKLGIKVEIIPSETWSESVAKVKRGEIDVLSETTDSNLKSQLNFTEDYISSPVVIVMRNEEDYVENLNQIKQRKIAVIKEYGYVPEIIKKHPDLKLHIVETIQEGLTAVSTGKVDALLATLAQTSFHISKLGIHNIRIVGKTQFNTKLAFGMREQFAPLVPLFNRALANISQGEKQRIFDIWGKQKYEEKINYDLILKIASAFVIIIAAVVYWNRKLSNEVDKRKASEAETRLLNQRFALATELVSLGVWQWDLSATNSFVFDDRMFEMYEMPRQNPVSFPQWISKLHPDDHQIIEHALHLLQKHGGQQHVEFRIVLADGNIRNIYSGATIVTNAQDGSTKLFGVNWDITERKQAEAQFKSIVDALPLAIVIADKNGKILLDNPQAIKEIGGNNSLMGRNTLEFYADPQDRNRVLEGLQKHGTINGREVKYQISHNKTIDCLLSVLPVNYQNQQVWLAVIINLTDRISHEKDLAVAKEQADNANRAKSEFLSNMSHEIRTPMNAIIGFTELLNEQVEEPRLKSFVKTIQSASHNLLTLINDILDLSKIEAGKFQIEKTPCNPHELFSELGNIFMMKMAEKNLDFILEVDPVIPQSLQLDAIRLRQVLLNLIGNAVKFTDKGFVKLIARTENADPIQSKLDLVIDIEDSGIGIAEDQQRRIFQEFEQSNGQDIRTYGGTGLGLSISKRLITLMGGELSLKSQLAKGSTFSIKLCNVDIASLTIDSQQKEQQGEIRIQFHPANILIVDDIKDNRDLLLALFADTKLTAVEAENGLKAVDLVKQNHFDFILMDIRMPVMDGYQATQKIKSFSNVPIVALTASVMTDDFERLKSSKFDGYLRKPVLRADLISELCKVLPFEQIAVVDSSVQVKPLTDSELECLPFALEALKKLTEQCNTVSKSNKISEIQAFADVVMEIAKQHPVSVIREYAEQLNNVIDSFDIAAIKRLLHEYSQLINRIVQLK